MKLSKLTLTIKTGIQARIVCSFVIIILIQLLPTISKGQVTKESFNIIVDQVASPIKREIRSFIRGADKKKPKCDLNFFAIKFIINKDSFAFDSVILSMPDEQELKKSISSVFRKENVDWKHLLKDFSNNGKDYQLLLFIHLTRDKCPIIKLSEVEMWDTFNNLIMLGSNDLNQVIILGSISMSMNH